MPEKKKKLEKKEKKSESEELKSSLQRLQADFENAMKRKEKEIEQHKVKEKVTVLRSFLPVLDSLDESLKHSKDDGLKKVHEQFLQTLNSNGVKEIECFDFNPHEMECLLRSSEKGKKENSVLEVFQKGYLFNDAVLRPAKVKVNVLEENSTEKEKEGGSK